MTEEAAARKSNSGNVRKYADNVLPMARIKKIMKMDPNITDNINIEANYLVCAAAELFIKQLSKDAYEIDSRGILTYKNLATCIQSDDKLDFLHAVVPNKITVREYKKILAEEKVPTVDSEGSDESSSEEESGSEEGSDEESDKSADEKPAKK